MRPIILARIDTMRPALVLTREIVRPHLQRITVAPVTSTIRGLSTEVPVGTRNGLDHDSVVACDNITTIEAGDIGEHIGYLLPDQEGALTEAIRVAYDLE